MSATGRLLIVDDDRQFTEELVADGERLGLSVEALHDPSRFEDTLFRWAPTIIAMDLVMPRVDGLELLHICGRNKFVGSLILMSGGFDLYLKMAGDIASSHGLNVAAQLSKPFRPKQFSYILMSLIRALERRLDSGPAGGNAWADLYSRCLPLPLSAAAERFGESQTAVGRRINVRIPHRFPSYS